ncbi:Polyketide synthase PksN [Phycisphaerae bacterium RAS1]|nr:Polyketide synthase PksN [Phycisphaerae bacterium RAS1]
MSATPVAIVGVGVAMPGALSPGAFWRNIAAGRDMARNIPPGRWILDPRAAIRADGGPDSVPHGRGCYVDDFDLDLTDLDVDPAALRGLDPVYKLALHAGAAAWRDGVTSGVDRTRVGVYLAAIALPTDGSSAWSRRVTMAAAAMPPNRGSADLWPAVALCPNPSRQATGCRSAGSDGQNVVATASPAWNTQVVSLPAALLAAALGLRGGSFTLDAACASSLYALKLAQDELQSGRADVMLAGGVSRPECLYTQMGFHVLQALSRSGVCRPFDAAADGLIVGEGAGVLMLKRLDDALKAGDRIYGVIRGIGLSNDMAGSLLAADSEGQLRAMRAAYEQAGWSPTDVDLIECHGTGTPLGDAVELQSLRTLWPRDGFRTGGCPIGSVKSMVGHLLTAAGAAGLIKVLWAMKAAKLPPSLNYDQSPPGAEPGGSPFRVQTATAEWPRRSEQTPRRAAVSAFGFGGINAHVLIEEFASGEALSAAGPAGGGRATTAEGGRATDAIAIVGMAGRIGAADGALIERVMFERESLSSTTIGELKVPLGRFRLPPAEIPELLPQQLLMLQVAADALQDAGGGPRPDPRAAVLIGIALDPNTSNYHLRWTRPREERDACGPALNAARVLGSLGSVVASRIAREFGLGGPSFAVSAAEASGPRALEIALRALRTGEIDRALVGAVDFAGDVRTRAARAALGAGDAPGDAAFAFVLKRQGDAQRDGDRIHALIDGAGFACGASLTPGDADAIESAIRRACGDAAVDAAELGLIEVDSCDDSTGAAVQRCIAAARSAAPTENQTTAIGRGAARFGGLGAAGGAASLFMAVTALRERRLPGSYDANGWAGAWDQGLFHAPLVPQYWAHDRAAGLRRAGVLSTTIDGGASFVILEESCAIPTAGSLPDAVQSRHATGRRPPQEGGRGARDVAFVFPGSGNHFVGMGREIGCTWPHVVDRLHEESLHAGSQLAPQLAWPRRSDWTAGWEADALRRMEDSTADLIMAQVSYGVVMSDLLRSFGLEPAAVIGYSLGETTGLFALRAWPDRDDMYRRMQRSPLFRSELAGACDAARRTWRLAAGERPDWRVVVVNRGPHEVRRALRGRERAYLLIINADDECVIGGQRTAVDAVVLELGCHAHAIAGASSVHCPIVAEVEAAYRELHLLMTRPPAGVRFYSAARAEAYEVTRESAAESITAQALHGFDFRRIIEQAYADGVRHFVEIGPGASCSRMIAKILAGKPHTARSASGGGENEADAVRRLLRALVEDGVLERFPPAAEPRTAGLVAKSEAPALRVPARSVGPLRPTTDAVKHRLEADTTAYEIHGVASAQLARDVARAGSAQAAAHDAFLRFSQTATATLAESAGLAARLAAAGGGIGTAVAGGGIGAAATRGEATAAAEGAPRPPVFDSDACMEFAVGSIARVLGPRFAPVDSYQKRVRLPDEPLMLVHRIVDLSGEPASLSHGTIATEHDVRDGAWYLDHGRTPVCIAVEAGQADLFLCSYLGIDLAVKGARAYRLLDAQIRFHRELPRPGETIRYDITIDRFVRQGDAWLFFFRFDATIAGVPLLTMRSGCAGFFTDEEIAESRGILLSSAEEAPAAPGPDDSVAAAAMIPIERCAFSATQLDRLRAGDLVGCFGPQFANLDLESPLRIPGGKMRLLHRVVELDPAGGRYRRGVIRGEADIRADDWFLTCHFVDDMVMPGTLMYQCCEHTLRVLLLRMGWVGEEREVGFEPLLETPCALKCRGPVTPKTRVVIYEVHVKRIRCGPEPGVVADAFMYADGLRIVQFTDMSLRMTGATRDSLAALWRQAGERPVPEKSDQEGRVPGETGWKPIPQTKPAVFDRDRILAFAVGKPSDAFGEPYRVFDEQRRIARLPGPPYMLMDRVTEIAAEPWNLKAGGWIEAQYDLPPDAWYFAANRQADIPFCILLEIALQPCGWLAAYLGSALKSDEDLRFRNLGGKAILHQPLGPDAGTLTTRIRITDVSVAGGMIIEKFDFEVRSGGQVAYAGDTYFGFFSDAALAQQVGVRGAAERALSLTAADQRAADRLLLPDEPPLTPAEGTRYAHCPLALPAAALRMVDSVDVSLGGGPRGLGWVRGEKAVDPTEWFFAAHFYQDPVCPGSLGLESFLQLLKVYARRRWPRLEATHCFSTMLEGRPHEWTYRGQVIPRNKKVEVEALITHIEDGPAPFVLADGFLKVDGLHIYEMKDFGIRLKPHEGGTGVSPVTPQRARS